MTFLLENIKLSEDFQKTFIRFNSSNVCMTEQDLFDGKKRLSFEQLNKQFNVIEWIQINIMFVEIIRSNYVNGKNIRIDIIENWQFKSKTFRLIIWLRAIKIVYTFHYRIIFKSSVCSSFAVLSFCFLCFTDDTK